MKIYLVRHGKADSNLINTPFNGNIDDRLTEEGFQDVKRVAERLKSTRFHIIFSSPMTRAVQTAEEISRKKSPPVKIICDERLTELKPGIFGGLTYEEIMLKYNNIFEERKKNKFLFRIPHGESYEDLFKRVDYFMRDVFINYAENDLLIVTHATTIKLFLLLLTDMNLEDIEKETFKNTCIFEFDVSYISNKFKSKVLVFNSTSHLKNE